MVGVCANPNCWTRERQVIKSRGYCRACYYRLLRAKSREPPPSYDPKRLVCGVPGCSGERYLRDLCRECYARWVFSMHTDNPYRDGERPDAQGEARLVLKERFNELLYQVVLTGADHFFQRENEEEINHVEGTEANVVRVWIPGWGYRDQRRE